MARKSTIQGKATTMNAHRLLFTTAAAMTVLSAAAQIPALPSGVSFSTKDPHFSQQGGESLYRSICQGCHMAAGQGAKGAGMYPALANNPRLAAAGYPVYVVLAGYHGMPPFGDRLDDQQVADVVNFTRTNFGSRYPDTVTAEDVKKMR